MKSTNELTKVNTYSKADCILFNSQLGKKDQRAMMFSNFQPFEFEVDGLTFHSTEQRYQWLRLAQKPEFQAKIMTYTDERNGWKCKEYVGKRQVKLFVDMDIERRINDMRECLRYKVEFCEGFKDLLMATGNATLVEYAPWGDTFWGAKGEGRGGKGATLKGANVMGKLLMELRELNNDPATEILTEAEIAGNDYMSNTYYIQKNEQIEETEGQKIVVNRFDNLKGIEGRFTVVVVGQEPHTHNNYGDALYYYNNAVQRNCAYAGRTVLMTLNDKVIHVTYTEEGFDLPF